MQEVAADPLVTPGEALALLRAQGLRIDISTLRRWAASRRMASEVLPSGHRRFRQSDVLALVTGHNQTGPTEPTEPVLA